MNSTCLCSNLLPFSHALMAARCLRPCQKPCAENHVCSIQGKRVTKKAGSQHENQKPSAKNETHLCEAARQKASYVHQRVGLRTSRQSSVVLPPQDKEVANSAIMSVPHRALNVMYGGARGTVSKSGAGFCSSTVCGIWYIRPEMCFCHLTTIGVSSHHFTLPGVFNAGSCLWN